MSLKDIKTLQDVSKEIGTSVKTLQGRLALKSFNMIEGEDYKKLGERQPTILSDMGVKKIRGDFKQLDMKKLKGKSFYEGCTFMGLKEENFEINIGEYSNGKMVDLDYTITQIDCFGEEEKSLVTFTLSEDLEDEYLDEDIYSKKGYWHFEEITD